MAYDIIGDIHGQDGKLTALLKQLGYRVKNGAWRHPQGRTTLFLGDLVDRGPGQREVIRLVRDMIEAGSGRSIMGNHEWNAIGFATRHPETGEFLRPRTANKRREHAAFLHQVGEDSPLHEECVSWMKTLPPCLDLGAIRLCHAWWNPGAVAELTAAAGPDGALSDEFLTASFAKSSAAWNAMEAVTKGLEIRLPPGYSFRDHNGVERFDIRARWWDRTARTYRATALVPEAHREALPDLPVPEGILPAADNLVPTFVGHYWLAGTPVTQGRNLAVLDWGAGLKGPLVAYRWDGEDSLTSDNLVWTESHDRSGPGPQVTP